MKTDTGKLRELLAKAPVDLNSEYVTVVVNALPALLDEVDALRADVARMTKERDEFRAIGQGFERDGRSFFEQSCKSLSRAVTAESTVAELTKERDALRDLAMDAWVVIANASCGDWGKESKAWTGAAEKWRDRWHTMMPKARKETA